MASLKYTVINSRKQYNEYCKIVDNLLEADHPNQQQDQEIELLTVLIEKWDNDHSDIKNLDPVEIIRSLMKEHGLNASDLTTIIDVSKSHVSEILNYKKGLSKEVIRKLAAHFKMNQEAFNRSYNLNVNKRVSIHKKESPHTRAANRL